MNIKKQIRRLMALECVGYFRPAGCIWVLLLAARGFSLAEIGFAEGVFHLVSLICEIPSGIAADLLGRRRALAAGQLVFALSCVMMLLSRSLTDVCLNMALSALGYNLASGTREALTYDSLVVCGREDEYLQVSSRQNTVYRLTTAVAMLCAGWVASVGYMIGYTIDILFCLAGFGIALSLREPEATAEQKKRELDITATLHSRLSAHIGQAWGFLRSSPAVVWLMLFNALVGALATLLGFYLQDALHAAGATAVTLGPLLIGIGLGGAVGSRMAPLLARLPYRAAALLSCAVIGCGFGMAAGGILWIMALGGFMATAGDDALQTLTDARLNDCLPSDQRATLVSVSSMCFSLVMVVLSPLMGILVG